MSFKVWLLAIVSWLAVVPRLWHEGTNIVTETYRLGTVKFFAGADPYVLPLIGGDRFEYSPLFCFFYAPFAYLPLKIQALSWALVNATVFWWGVGHWVSFKVPRHWWIWPALIFCSMELNISLLYQQSNALIIGLSLVGLARYRDQNYFAAGFLLTVAAVLKIYPALFILLVAFPLRRDFCKGILAAGIIALLLPALVVGPSADVALHLTWARRLLEAAAYQREDLDIASVLARSGAPLLGQILKGAIVVTTLGGAATFKPTAKNLALWVVVATTFLLLMNPRSESPTFVFLAPAYLILSPYVFGRTSAAVRWPAAALFYLAAFGISFVFTDAWPKSLWDPGSLRYGSKTAGAFILWGLALGYLAFSGSDTLTKAKFSRPSPI